jgi:glutathione peroxidase
MAGGVCSKDRRVIGLQIHLSAASFLGRVYAREMRLASTAGLLTMSLFAASSIHDFTLTRIEGGELPLAGFKGKILVVVNTASQCGYTGQYAGLESISGKYKDRGLVVLGVPANNFGGQEPGTNEEIKTFCSRNYHVTFPMTSKVSVKGSDTAPLFKHLSDAAGAPKWNFTKYLVDRDGKVIAKFDSAVDPESKEFVSAIEAALQ